MSNEVRLWQIESDENLNEIQRSSLDLEARLQDWLARDMKLEDPQTNATLRTVTPDRPVTFVGDQWYGYEAWELTYKTPEQILLAGIRQPGHY